MKTPFTSNSSIRCLYPGAPTIVAIKLERKMRLTTMQHIKDANMKLGCGFVYLNRSSVGSVLLLAAVGKLAALAPTRAFHWVPSQVVPRPRWHHDLASRTRTGIFATGPVVAATKHAKLKAVNDWPKGNTSTHLDPTPVVDSPWRAHLSKVKRNTTAKARAMAAPAVFAVVLFLSPLAAEAAKSGGRIGGSFPRRFDDATAVQLASPRSGTLPLTTSLAGGGLCHIRGGGSGRSPYAASKLPTKSAGIGRTSTLVASADVALSTEDTILAVFQLGCLGCILYCLVLLSLPYSPQSALGTGTSVIQVTVAMRVYQQDDPSSILSALQRLVGAAKYQSDLPELLSEAATELLRRKSSIVSAFAMSKHFRVRDRALREYGFLSVTERVKVRQETSPASPLSSLATSGYETMAVVTLLLAIDGHMTRPRPIRSLASLEDALKTIAVDAKTDWCLQKAEVLWTPSEPNGTLTAMDVMVDYPQLRSVEL
jgi:uncharacterized membrane protein